MKILFFTQFYRPESIAPSFRASENSKIWTELGHEVTVFTGYPNYPKGKIFDGYSNKLISEECDGKVRVIRSKLIAKTNTNIFCRLVNALSYYVFGIINIVFNTNKIGRDYDLVLGTSGVIFNALLAYQFSKKIKKPFVFEIRDITYIQMQATGKNANSIGVVVMKWLELFLCKKAVKVVTVTNGFKKVLIQEGIYDGKVEVITNGVDVEACIRDSTNEFGLSYFGTIGVSQNIADTFEYAMLIDELVDNFKYLIIGDGAERKNVFKVAQGYRFIEMLPGMPSKELEKYYYRTDLSVVTLVNSDKFRYTIPSKLFQIMGRGIAVLYIGPPGEAADIIVDSHCGIALTGNKDENLRMLREFFRDDWLNEIKVMGNNGRKLVEQKYNRAVLGMRYIKIMESINNQREEF